MEPVTIPTVVLRGRLIDHSGQPITEQCFLRPRQPQGCFELDGHLISTRSYVIQPTASGHFAKRILPTDVGVAAPWWYDLVAPNFVIRLRVNLEVGVADLQDMLAEGAM